MNNSALFKKPDFLSRDCFLFILYSFLLLIFIIETPNKIVYLHEYPCIVGVVGFIGLYRYGLWVIHLIRAQIYEIAL